MYNVANNLIQILKIWLLGSHDQNSETPKILLIILKHKWPNWLYVKELQCSIKQKVNKSNLFLHKS